MLPNSNYKVWFSQNFPSPISSESWTSPILSIEVAPYWFSYSSSRNAIISKKIHLNYFIENLKFVDIDRLSMESCIRLRILWICCTKFYFYLTNQKRCSYVCGGSTKVPYTPKKYFPLLFVKWTIKDYLRTNLGQNTIENFFKNRIWDKKAPFLRTFSLNSDSSYFTSKIWKSDKNHSKCTQNCW